MNLYLVFVLLEPLRLRLREDCIDLQVELHVLVDDYLALQLKGDVVVVVPCNSFNRLIKALHGVGLDAVPVFEISFLHYKVACL